MNRKVRPLPRRFSFAKEYGVIRRQPGTVSGSGLALLLCRELFRRCRRRLVTPNKIKKKEILIRDPGEENED
mgnify:FL=1